MEYERDALDKQIKEKGTIELIDTDNFKAIRKKLIKYVLEKDSPEIRELIMETVDDIRIDNDNVMVKLMNV